MPMRGDRSAVVSRRGAWRAGRTLRFSGLSGAPADYAYEFRAWRPDCDEVALFATTLGSTDRLVVIPRRSLLRASWNFPVQDIVQLAQGAHRASLVAVRDGQPYEIESFVFVVDGGPPRRFVLPLPIAPGLPGDPDIPTPIPDVVNAGSDLVSAGSDDVSSGIDL